MSRGQDSGQLDWLVELAAACAPAAAAGFAAMKLAPVWGWPLEMAVLAASGGMFVLAYGVMRLVPAETRLLALPAFDAPAFVDDALLLDDILPLDELLLTRRHVEWDELLLDQPLVEKADMTAVAELLLDDPLPAPAPDSRVVQLFAGNRMPTAGQLQQRIDRHLADGQRPDPVEPDASDALSEALAELRRSLRQA